jgi:hypothetical protein
MNMRYRKGWGTSELLLGYRLYFVDIYTFNQKRNKVKRIRGFNESALRQVLARPEVWHQHLSPKVELSGFDHSRVAGL